MYGTGYEPSNWREKLLMRIAFWGTVPLVAFLLWEYVRKQ